MLNKLSTLDSINQPWVGEYYEAVRESRNDVGLYNEVDPTTEIIIVPYWISDAIRRNKLDHIDILEYSSMQRIMSIEDMGQLLNANANLIPGISGNDYSYEYRILGKWDKDGSNFNIISQLYRLLDILTTKQDIISRLTKDNFNIADIESPETLYQVELKSDSNIYIVVRAGFMNAMNSNEFRKQFYSDVLKKLYSLVPIHNVSKYEIFKHYLKTLNNT